MTVPIITYEIPLNQVRAEIETAERRLERQLNAGVDDVLKFIENEQILAYGADSNPARPPGSRYVRTFDLQSASETERTGTKLPDISGVWRVNLSKARYGEKVLGTRQQQAPIHRGRWKSKTDVENAAKEAAPGIIEEHLK